VVVGHIIPHEQKDGQQQQKGDFLVAFELGTSTTPSPDGWRDVALLGDNLV